MGALVIIAGVVGVVLVAGVIGVEVEVVVGAVVTHIHAQERQVIIRERKTI